MQLGEIPRDYTCVRWETESQTGTVAFWLYILLLFQPFQSSHCSQKWKGGAAYLQKHHVMISRNCIVGSDRADRTGRKENCQGCVLCYICNMTF